MYKVFFKDKEIVENKTLEQSLSCIELILNTSGDKFKKEDFHIYKEIEQELVDKETVDEANELMAEYKEKINKLKAVIETLKYGLDLHFDYIDFMIDGRYFRTLYSDEHCLLNIEEAEAVREVLEEE